MNINDIVNHPLYSKAETIPHLIQDNMHGRVGGGNKGTLYIIKVLMLYECKVYMEIGVMHGGSMCVVMSNKYKTKFVGIDAFIKPFDTTTGIPITRDNAEVNINSNNPHGHDYEIIQGLSTDDDVIRRVQRDYPIVDFLFIDGDHNEPAVRQDLINYGSLVRRGGIVVFDDYNDQPWSGIKELEKDLDLRVWNKVGVFKEQLILERR